MQTGRIRSLLDPVFPCWPSAFRGSARRLLWLVLLLAASFPLVGGGAVLPERDQRLRAPRDLNTPWEFPAPGSRGDWERRARAIREHILVATGLWPMPARTPLHAQISGRIEREDYTVEKVSFESYPGFFVAGNLYRPRPKAGLNTRFPAVLNPHGHWSNGRMADTPEGSIAARCIQFARHGMVAFSYDMVGYNDTVQVPHTFARDRTNQLWNISLMGLQTWNSIRALDFLSGLPDVDPARLACTGESGGGTQTFMLGAIDDRLSVQAPIVMVSHSMQGGCLCENAPGLRTHFSNMEIAAAPAPRPQILVAATGDWTRATLTMEGPAMARVYQLFGTSDRFSYQLLDYGHNYNRASREAVYAWFGAWLTPTNPPGFASEKAYTKEPDADLRVWPDGQLPTGALNEPALIAALIENGRRQWSDLRPADGRSFEYFKRLILPAWRRTMDLEPAENAVRAQSVSVTTRSPYTVTRLLLGQEKRGSRLPALLISPARENLRYLVVLVHPQGKRGFLDADGMPIGLARQILERRQSVLLVDTFLTGELADPALDAQRRPFERYFTTYNRTDVQERVQDIITACAFAQNHSKGRKVVVCGAGRAGLWTLLAAPAADAVVADCDQVDSENDGVALEQDLFVPGIRRIGGWEGAAALAAPHPVLLHHTGEKFRTSWLRDAYKAAGAPKNCRVETNAWDETQVVDWIARVTAN